MIAFRFTERDIELLRMGISCILESLRQPDTEPLTPEDIKLQQVIIAHATTLHATLDIMLEQPEKPE